MKDGIIAKRYAGALFDLTLNEEEKRRALTDLKGLVEVCRDVPLVSRGLGDGGVDLSDRIRAANDISKLLKISDTVRKGLCLLITNGRLGLLPAITRDFEARLLCMEQIANAKVTVAEEGVAGELKERVESTMGGLMKMDVRCDVEVDPGILGGFIIQISDVQYDASVAGRLERMKEDFISGRRVWEG